MKLHANRYFYEIANGKNSGRAGGFGGRSGHLAAVSASCFHPPPVGLPPKSRPLAQGAPTRGPASATLDRPRVAEPRTDANKNEDAKAKLVSLLGEISELAK